MLQVIRERAQGVLAWIIIGAICLSFALWGLNSYFSETDEGFQAALVNDEKVTVYEYRIAYSNEQARMQQMFGDNFDADMFEDQIKQTALNRVIDNSLLIQQAANAGMRVSDEQLAQRIQSIGAFLEEGVFSRAVYEQQINQAGESTAGFEYRIRRGLIADQLVNGVIGSSFATNDEIALIVKLRDQEREIGYVTIPVEKFKKDIKVTDEEIKAHYDANTDKYKTQEKVQLDYLEMKVEDLMSSVVLGDTELEDYYEEQKERFVTQEQRRARHILVELGEDADAAKQKAQGIYEKAKAGEDFETLAKENSDDVGSASEGGDLGFFAKGIMDENFEEAAYSMNAGDISEPVRSEFGYHIIKLEEIQASTGKTFSEVRADIESEVKKAKAEKLYFDKVEQLANLTYETPDSLESAKVELGLMIKTSPLVGKRGGPGIFSNRKITDAAFSDDVLTENLNSEVIEISSSHSVVVRLKEHKPSQVKPLEEVKAQITNLLTDEKALTKAESVAGSIAEKIKSGTAAEDAASELEYSWNEKKWVKRDDSGVPREIVQAAFEIKRIDNESLETKGVKVANGDYALLTLTGVKDGDVTSLSDEEKKQITDGIANASGVDSFTTMLKALKDEAEIKKFPGNL